MTVKGGTNQACAACKYQRRKCSADCVLAPYFPPDQPKMFQNAHELFGVSNILKVLKQIHPSQRKDAMRSIICHANIRDRYPVYGCCGIISELEYQIQQTTIELDAVNAQLAMYRQQYNNNQHHQSSSPSPNDSPSSKLQLGQALSPSNAALPLFQPCRPQQSFNNAGIPPPGYANAVFALQQSQAANAGGLAYGNNMSAGYNVAPTTDYVDSKDVNLNSVWNQQQTYNQTNNYMTPTQYYAAQEIPIKQQDPVVEQDPQDYDEIPAFFDVIDDRQSYIDSKEAYESSSDSSFKDTTRSNIEQVSENELKSAAACFSLTSVN